MKILHTVESYLPAINGMSEVVKQISERLVEYGHNVTVATSTNDKRKDNSINGVKIVDFKIFGNYAGGISGEIVEYKNYLLKSDFDVIVNFAAQQWATDLLLPILKDINAKKIFVPTGFSNLYNTEYANYYQQMVDWMKNYDKIVFHSTDYRDARFARDNNINNSVLIPNGADEREFSQPENNDFRDKNGIPESNSLILHVGSNTGIKGHYETLQIFLESKISNSSLVFISNDQNPINNFSVLEKIALFLRNIRNLAKYAKLILDKRKFKKLVYRFSNDGTNKNENRQVILLDANRKDTIEAYFTSDLFLFPSKIECSPIVLFEAMASKTAFLVTDVGNSKEIIEWSEAGVLLPTEINEDKNYCLSNVKIDEAARILYDIVNDKELIKTMSNNGYHSWKEKFTWEKIARQYENLFLDVIEN